jgi:hypothetical protein
LLSFGNGSVQAISEKEFIVAFVIPSSMIPHSLISFAVILPNDFANAVTKLSFLNFFRSS